MKITKIIIIIAGGWLWTLVAPSAAFSQCLPEKQLWNRIIYLRDSARPANDIQLTELSGYLDRIHTCAYQGDSTHAFLLQRMGFLEVLVHNVRQGLAYTRQSIGLIYQNSGKPGINPRHVIKTYNNLRIIYDSLKDEAGSNAAIDSCIAVSVRLNAGFEYSLSLLYGRTQQLFEKGDYYRCIANADLAEYLVQHNIIPASSYLRFLIWKANSLVFLEQDSAAEMLIQKTLAAYQGPPYASYSGTLYGLLAVPYEKRGDLQRSREYAGKAFEGFKRFQNNNGCASVLNNLGFNLYFNALHRYDEAMKCYRQALAYADSTESANILGNIAKVYVKTDRYDSAFSYFARAFSCLQPGISEQNILRQPDSWFTNTYMDYITGIIIDKGDAWLDYYKATRENKGLHEALRIYRIADSLLDRINEGQSEMLSQLFWREDGRRLYEHAIESSFLSGNSAEGFYFFEKSRASVLTSQLRELNWLNNRDVRKLAELKKEKSRWERDNRSEEVFRVNLEIQKIRQSIQRSNPLYAQSQLGPAAATLDRRREKILAGEDALVEIFSGDSAIYTLVITRQGEKITRTGVVRYDSLVQAYISFLSSPSRLNQDFDGFVAVSRQLHDLLFSDNPVPIGKIAISPDAAYYPFEALVENGNTSSPKYFLEGHAVSYTYSAQYLQNSFAAGEAPDTKDFLGVAPVSFPYRSDLSPLTGSDASLKNISYRHESFDNLLAEGATKHQFLQQFPRYRTIQLYTHASERSEDGEPMIYFSDSVLYLSDLVAIQRPVTRLIILSACETGVGKLYKGEGVFNFNRAFASMNVPSCVSNLWSVENEATYRLSEILNEELGKGLPLDVALQQAKLRFLGKALGKDQLPYYWAAMILAGQTTPMETHHRISLTDMAGMLAAILLLLLGWKSLRATVWNAKVIR